MKSSLCHLPEDIVENILLRLPPKSLHISCKRVCKSWYAMINNPKFIDKQLNVSIANNRHPSPVTLFFIWGKYGRYTKETLTGKLKQVLSVITIHDKDDGEGDHLPYVVEEFNLPPVPETETAGFPVMLSSSNCDGIILFWDRNSFDKEVFVLCNPELEEFKLLHTPHLPNFFFSGAGFGYDPKANDYKCVKLFSSLGRVGVVNRAMVYSLGTDSWREVKIDLNGKCHTYNGVYHKGVFYWWNIGLEDIATMVLSFDFSAEEFHTIELPQHARRLKGNMCKLDVWKESVVFFISTEMFSFEMWVMVENFGGVEGYTYWTKHLTIGPLARLSSPLAVWKDDELLIRAIEGQIVSYNLCTKKSRKLPSFGSVLQWIVHASLYSRSLVSLKRGNMINHG